MAKGQFFMFGVPFIALLVGGSYFLAQFTDVRYKYRAVQKAASEAKYKDPNRKKFDLNDEYQKMKQEIDLDSWVNKRVPRPEDNDKDDNK